MIRDISPSLWNARGVAKLSLGVMLATVGDDPLALDSWLSRYSVLEDYTVNLGSGDNALNWPNGSNQKVLIFIPPRGNQTSITLKGLSGDTGIALHPNCPLIFTQPPDGTAVGVRIVTGAAIAGCRWIVL